jgi:CheY-like chemotaxis protein
MKKNIIWIVDDDAIYQIIINKIIQKSEIFSSCASFKNGKEAINALSNLTEDIDSLPDIILLDINMPVMDGWEFMEEMKQIPLPEKQKINTYIVSSSIAPEDKNKSRKFSAISGYMSKPVSVSDLIIIAANSK